MSDEQDALEHEQRDERVRACIRTVVIAMVATLALAAALLLGMYLGGSP